MSWLYAWATPDFCLYHLSYDQLLILWRDGKINEKMQAIRIAGHIWGADIDAVKPAEVREDGTPDRDWFRKEFGMDYEELKNQRIS